MASCRAFLSLAICVLLGQQTCAKNDAPCKPSKRNNGHDTFLRRHVPSGSPNSLDQNAWEKFIKSLGGCDRPTQSFLNPDDLDRVKAVCTSGGGKVHEDNLCISKQPFTFVTVRSDPGTCGIRRVDREVKHLILACEVLKNQCVPVHFEGNPKNLKPDNNARGCQDPEGRNHGHNFKMSWTWLLFALLTIVYHF